MKGSQGVGFGPGKIYMHCVRPLIQEEQLKQVKRENEVGVEMKSDVIDNSYMDPFLKKWKKRIRNFHEKGIVYQSLQS
jgi:hypothetical protein